MKFVEAERAKDYAATVFGDPILKMAVNAAMDNVPGANVVEVPPIKLGDKAYFVINGQIFEAVICVIQWYAHLYGGVVDEIRGDTPGGSVGTPFSEWGKTVFATREEAEKAMKV